MFIFFFLFILLGPVKVLRQINYYQEREGGGGGGLETQGQKSQIAQQSQSKMSNFWPGKSEIQSLSHS